MKIRSLLLGSVAAAGLSTGAMAADLGVLTSLDVCDALGLSGLTISSDTNCLQISGFVSYELRWGDYQGNNTQGGAQTVSLDRQIGRVQPTFGGNTRIDGPLPGNWNGIAAQNNDWRSTVEAWVKLVGSAETDFGVAQAIIVMRQVERLDTTNERQGVIGANNVWSDLAGTDDTYVHGDTTTGVVLDEAYVKVGDSTVLMAGLRKRDARGSVGDFGDDTAYNFTGLVVANETDNGVIVSYDNARFGGPAIQVVSDLGNGVSVAAGLERLDGYATSASGGIAARTQAQNAGTAVGVISYKGDGITAHATGWALGVLDGNVDNYGFHAGASAVLDTISIRGAAGYEVDTATSLYSFHALGSAKATFDIFTIAISGEVTNTNNAVAASQTAVALAAGTGYGIGGSIGANVTEGVAINLGGKWYRNANGDDIAHGAAQIVASVTESIKLTGEVGAWYGSASNPAPQTVYYGAAEVAWTPGGSNNFTASAKGEVFSNGAYRATFKATKAFQ